MCHSFSPEMAEQLPPDEDICDLADFFKVFGDSSRLKVLWALHQGELCVSHVAEMLNMSTAAVSHQLKILRQSHLVRTRRDGKNVYYSLADDHVLKILDMGLEHIYE
ncbi:MAG TPA: metalloregulator ArsR/SmtB family transcription factor [Candidatus Akkermansia intestinigallinarum]|uniref:Metalloregulator ArsR/SmtB family transcription factor n=1 Tax=Candidatus Akkermansia intestinigallinarum TaxID=2838431 RepID=A0A9D1VAM5_9BACT|nr:metalloregulator ArsR/SmtB family transcription factor [Candidatus Akkermansia intestinigallinarum]